MPRCWLTRSHFGAATRRLSTPMSKLCARCGRGWRASRGPYRRWRRARMPSGASFTTPLIALRQRCRPVARLEGLDAEMNPRIDPKIIAEAYEDDPECQGRIRRRVSRRPGRLCPARDGRRGDHVGPRAAARAGRRLQRLRRSVRRRLGFVGAGDCASRSQRRLYPRLVLNVGRPSIPRLQWRNAPYCCAVIVTRIVGDKYAGEWPTCPVRRARD